MKKNYYQTYVEINKDSFLYFNSLNDKFLLLNNEFHHLFQLSSLSEIEKNKPKLYKALADSLFIVDDDFDELVVTNYKKLKKRMDTMLYHIVVNTTLDCNLNCWYCYESKVKGSALSEKVIEAIKKNIVYTYNKTPFLTLKISFFGGEPFMNFHGIQEILTFSKDFCNAKKVRLIADFTTNATLITKSHIDFLKDFLCYFQITLDGDKKLHNRVKKFKDSKIGAYQLTMQNIYKLSTMIPQCLMWVRVNFDARTLQKFDDILDDISDLDRKRCFLILRKVWQFPSNKIDPNLLMSVLQKIIDNKFYVDYYALPRTELCFAERMNQVLFNYDGKVFKCSTLTSFEDKNSMGYLDLESGKVNWDIKKIAPLMQQKELEKCVKCKIYPSCLGPCNKNMLRSKYFVCIVDEMNLTIDEFLMYNFKLNLLLNA